MRLGLLIFIISVFPLIETKAQVLLTESFDYLNGEYLDNHNWYHSSISPDTLIIDPVGLTYPGYLGGGRGRSVKVGPNNTDLRDIWLRHFTPVASGSIYLSFLINVTDYSNKGFNSPIALSPGNTALYARVYLEKVDATQFKLGLSSTFGGNLLLNETYLVIVKYEVVSGEDNDLTTMFVYNNGLFPTEEPISAYINSFTTGTGDPSEAAPLQNVVLFSVEGSINNNLRIDEIRVGLSWNDLRATSVTGNSTGPETLVLFGNYPNPFNPSTTILYETSLNEKVKVTIFNALGQELEVLENQFESSGSHFIKWDAEYYPSGVYLYTVQSESSIKFGKMILMK